MFGPPGHAYVYRVYGMHDCLNVVTEPAGSPAALLIRAVAPLEGIETMRQARIERAASRHRLPTSDHLTIETERIGRLSSVRLASGPGLVAAAFGLDRGASGADLCDPASSLRLECSPDQPTRAAILATPRIGIDGAGSPWTSLLWRLSLAGHPSVSGPVGAR